MTGLPASLMAAMFPSRRGWRFSEPGVSIASITWLPLGTVFNQRRPIIRPGLVQILAHVGHALVPAGRRGVGVVRDDGNTGGQRVGDRFVERRGVDDRHGNAVDFRGGGGLNRGDHLRHDGVLRSRPLVGTPQHRARVLDAVDRGRKERVRGDVVHEHEFVGLLRAGPVRPARRGRRSRDPSRHRRPARRRPTRPWPPRRAPVGDSLASWRRRIAVCRYASGPSLHPLRAELRLPTRSSPLGPVEMAGTLPASAERAYATLRTAPPPRVYSFAGSGSLPWPSIHPVAAPFGYRLAHRLRTFRERAIDRVHGSDRARPGRRPSASPAVETREAMPTMPGLLGRHETRAVLTHASMGLAAGARPCSPIAANACAIVPDPAPPPHPVGGARILRGRESEATG